jgi:hypothetical protein
MGKTTTEVQSIIIGILAGDYRKKISLQNTEKN